MIRIAKKILITFGNITYQKVQASENKPSIVASYHVKKLHKMVQRLANKVIRIHLSIKIDQIN